jgi:hypothetical protein
MSVTRSPVPVRTSTARSRASRQAGWIPRPPTYTHRPRVRSSGSTAPARSSYPAGGTGGMPPLDTGRYLG